MSLLTALLLAGIAAGLIALLERTNRRTAHLPRAPFGTDHESYEWDAFRELQHDLDALERGCDPKFTM